MIERHVHLELTEGREAERACVKNVAGAFSIPHVAGSVEELASPVNALFAVIGPDVVAVRELGDARRRTIRLTYRDGLRFSWIRALCVADKALYVGDPDKFRILKAAPKYAAEEEVALP